MIINISDCIATFLSKGIYEDLEEVEVISYGIQGLLSTFVNTIIAILISSIFGLMYEFLLFNMVFIPIRMMHKSYHCTTFIGCVISSNCLILISTLLLKYISINPYFNFIVFTILILVHYSCSLEKRKLFNSIIYISFICSLHFEQKVSTTFLLVVIINILLIEGRKLHEKNIN